MTDFNAQHNRATWFDIPVGDVDRAATFYREVLAIAVSIENYDGMKFGVLEHGDGNGACLVTGESWTPTRDGTLVYYNVDGRIRAATNLVEASGGTVLEDVHPIGPYGFRSIVVDSEGNRIALHSNSDK